jgi:hypothetical protein
MSRSRRKGMRSTRRGASEPRLYAALAAFRLVAWVAGSDARGVRHNARWHCRLKPMPRHERTAWEDRRDLCCLADADLLLPDAERLGASAAIASGGHEMTSRPEVAVDHRVRREEPLCPFR